MTFASYSNSTNLKYLRNKKHKFSESLKRATHFLTTLSMLAGLLIASHTTFIAPANGSVTVVATGTSPTNACNQVVDNSSGVTAVRLANGDCLVRFTVAATFNWTVPAGITSVKALLVGGGGGGGGGGSRNGIPCSSNSSGARNGGGGGGGAGGQVRDDQTLSNLPDALQIVVGAAGAAGAPGSCGNAGFNGGTGGTSKITIVGSQDLVVAQGGGGGGGGLQNGAGGTGGNSTNSSGAVTTGASPLSINTCSESATDGCFAAGGGASSFGNSISPTLAGTNGVDTNGGTGASGISVSALETATYAGGGGGGNRHPASLPSSSIRTGGPGGSGGGGAGGAQSAGVAGTVAGAGGGGGRGNGATNANSTNAEAGGAGFSGLVLIRYAPAPNAPTINSVIAGDQNLSVAFTAPTSNGATATGYEYSIDNGSTWISTGGTTSPFTISSLTNGSSYTVLLRALNGTIPGSASAGVTGTPITTCNPNEVNENGFTTLTFTDAACNWVVPTGVTSAEVVVVAGGGGGGFDYSGGGGGAGEVLVTGSASLVSGTVNNVSGITVTPGSSVRISIGAGGSSGAPTGSTELQAQTSYNENPETSAPGGSGGDSSFGEIVAKGGGGGGGGGAVVVLTGKTGGSGGGGAGSNGSGGSVSGNTYLGWTSFKQPGSAGPAGGGGGAGNAGDSGNGGSGITVLEKRVAGGGGGWGKLGSARSLTDTVLGGNGRLTTENWRYAGTAPNYTSNGVATTGTGGGAGAFGGSGVVIVRYVNAPVTSIANSTVSATVGSPVTSYSISNSGGAIASYAIDRELSVAGLTFSPSTGEISGTPTASVSSATYTITATNTSGTSFATFSISVGPAVSIETPITGLTGTVGTPYTLTLATSGGSGGNDFTVSSGSLPAGLSLNSSTGVISGTPTAAGPSAVVITVTDSGNATASTSSFTITISAATLSNAATPTVSATAGTLKSISVSWTAVTNASSYTIKLYAANGTTLLQTLTGLSGTEKAITTSDYSSIADNTAYQISLTAVGTGNYATSSESSKASVTTNQSFTVTYNYNNATSANGNEFDSFVTGATAITLPVPTKTGSTFAGWFVDSGFTGSELSSTYTPTATVTLYAKWTVNTYTITYNYNDATSGNETATSTFTVGEAAITLPTPTKTGYTFAGWYEAANFSGSALGATYSPTQSRTIYARWTADTYTVTYNYNNATGGDGTATSSFTFGGTAITLPSPTRTNFTFNGWYESGLVTKVGDGGDGYSPTANISLFAKWTYSAAGWNSEIDYALDLDGVNDLAITTARVIDSTAFTLELWVYYDGTRTGTWRSIVNQYQDRDNRIYIGISNNNLLTYAWGGSGRLEIPNEEYALLANRWIHLALTRSSSGAPKLYVDGVLVSSSNTTNTTIPNGPLQIGDRDGEWFDGRVDQLKVWSAELTQSEILASMHSLGASQSDGSAVASGKSLVAYYDFNEGTGTTIHDRIGSANLTSTGGPTFVDVKTTTVLSDGATVVTFPRTYLSGVGGWKVPNGVTRVRSLVVAGGGAGGSDEGGGGGAGGLIETSTQSVSGVELVIVGQGGIGGGATSGTNQVRRTTSGQVSLFGTGVNQVSTIGGGAGGDSTDASIGGQSVRIGLSGGSGGGGSGEGSNSAAGSGTAGQGRNGANGSGSYGGGGGGAGGAASGRVGGQGIQSSITGTNSYYAAGGSGGGGNSTSTVGQVGTNGIGGAGGAVSANATAGVANTGSGGGGARYRSSTYSGAEGGAGVVIIRYSFGFEITFTSGSNGTGADQYLSKNAGEALTLPNSATANEYFTRTGFTVTGWSTSDGGAQTYAFGASYTTDAAITLYPVWTGNALNPTFDTPTATADGFTVQITNYDNAYTWAGTATASGNVSISGTGLVTVTGVAANTSSTLTITTTRTGYAGGSGTASATSIAIYAITYNYNDATSGNETATSTFTVGETAITLPIPTKTGYTFDGWYEAPNFSGSALGSTYSPTQSRTIYAKWTADVYTVTYNYNDATGGNGTATNTFTFGGSAITLPTPTKTGHIFAGWYEASNFSGTALGATYSPTQSRTIYAKWTADVYTITYNYNDATGSNGTATSSFTVGGAAITLPIPTRTGYTFDGWYEASNFSGTALGATYSPSQSRTIYAKWTANTLTLTFHKNDGTGTTATQSITAATSTALSSNSFTRTGYTFAGWSANSDGTGTQYTDGQSVTLLAATNFYAKWTANTLTVTFNKNDGSGNTSTQSITAGSATALTTNAFTRTGYTFSGWTANSDGSGASYGDEESVTIFSNLPLYAKWTAISYTVTYNTNGATGSAPTQANRTIGQTFNVAAATGLTRTGYTFGGWSDGTNTFQPNAIFTVASSNVTLIAQWNLDTYTITYSANNGTGSAARITDAYIYGSAALVLPGRGSLARAGYSFAGWSETSGGSAISGTYTPTQSRTLYAFWTANTYTITYNSNGATGSPSVATENYTTGNAGSNLAAQGSMTKLGHDFAGWATAAGATVNEIVSTPYTTTSSLTLYAVWSPIGYTISFNLAGGNSTLPTISAKFYNESFNLPAAATRADNTNPAFSWAFVAWSDGSNEYQAGSSYRMGTANIEFIAIWIRVFTVKYTMNGASTAAPADVFSSDGSTVTLAGTPTRAGYSFTGWKDQSGQSYAAGALMTVDIDSYLVYAQWSPINYNVSYLLNGGTSTQPTETAKTIGQTVTVAAAPTRAGHQFNGWSYNSQLYGAGAIVIVATSDITFTANWSAISYTVTYDMNGSTTTRPTVSNKTIGQIFNLAAAPSRAGYTFAGWSDGNQTKNAGTSYEVGSSDITLTATWTAVAYTLTYDVNGGNSSAPSGLTGLNIGNTFTVAAAPTHENRTFLGWSDGTNTYTAGQSYVVGSSNITLSAVWSGVNYNIIYDLNGGSGTAPTESAKEAGQSITVKSNNGFSRANFTFAGWKNGNQAVTPNESLSIGNSDVTLVAQWTPAFTVSFAANGGSATSNLTFTGNALAKPANPTRANFVFEGWTDNGNDVSWPLTPSGPVNLQAKWTQLSLYGLNPSDLARFGQLTKQNGVAASFRGSNASSSVAVDVPAGALPDGTNIYIDLVGNTARAQALIPATNSYLVSFVVSWLAPDGTVPLTAANKPISMTINNADIKEGAVIYSVVGDTYTILGRATQDGTVTIEIIEDPEILVAATKPDAPTNVTGSSTAATNLTASWSAPAINGGSAIISYTATTNTGQSCTTSTLSCTINGLTISTSYTVTVIATNSIGSSPASSPSAQITTTANVQNNGGGGGNNNDNNNNKNNNNNNNNNGGGSGGSGGSGNPGGGSTPVRETPNRPVLVTNDGRPTTAPAGVGKRIVDGVVRTELIRVVERQIVRTEFSGVAIEVKAVANNLATKDLKDNSTLVFEQAGRASLSGTGFKPVTTVKVWILSDPVFLGEAEVKADGSFDASLLIPANFPAGNHTLQINGITNANEVVTQTFGVVVEASKVTPQPEVVAPKAVKKLVLNLALTRTQTQPTKAQLARTIQLAKSVVPGAVITCKSFVTNKPATRSQIAQASRIAAMLCAPLVKNKAVKVKFNRVAPRNAVNLPNAKTKPVRVQVLVKAAVN